MVPEKVSLKAIVVGGVNWLILIDAGKVVGMTIVFPSLKLQPIGPKGNKFLASPDNFLKRLDFFRNGLMILARLELSVFSFIQNTELSISIPS